MTFRQIQTYKYAFFPLDIVLWVEAPPPPPESVAIFLDIE